MKKRGVFLGRFQPFHNQHLDVVKYILHEFHEFELMVGVADWRGLPNRDNFLNGIESQKSVRLSLAESGIKGVRVIGFPLFPNVSMEQTLSTRFSEESINAVFSGSEKTIFAVNNLVLNGMNLEIINLNDREDGIRASQIREWIREGEETWRKYVTPSVAEFLSEPLFRERLLSLVAGEKRPWGVESIRVSSNRVERK